VLKTVVIVATSAASAAGERLNRVSQEIIVRVGWLLNFDFCIKSPDVDALYSFLMLRTLFAITVR